MSDAAVGSVSHILLTAFKDVYEERKLRNAEEARTIRDERLATQKDSTPKSASKSRENLKTPQKASRNPDEAGSSSLETPAAENESSRAPEDFYEDTDEGSPANFYTPFQKIPLNENHQSTLIEKTAEVREVLKENVVKATQLTEYLSQQRELSHELELEEEEALKRRGIMVGQHIPSLPSKLALDRKVLQNFGTYSENLVVAKELVEQNLENSMRRTGLLPLSAVAETRKADRGKSVQCVDDGDPNYLQVTGNTEIRNKLITKRFEMTTTAAKEKEKKKSIEEQIDGLEFDDEVDPQEAPTGQGRSLSAGAIRPHQHMKKGKKKVVLSAEVRLANEAILNGMNHKLNYLRNPRNDPGTVISKMLVKAKEYAPTSGPMINGRPVTAAVMTSEAAPLFSPYPKSVCFSNYDVGLQYTQSISFRNVSSVSRTVRVIPVNAPCFSLSELKYPSSCVGGVVAPGMSVSAVVTFIPNSMGDYAASLKVETEGGCFDVMISAQREAPRLSIPSDLDIGACLVGDAMSSIITCSNSGGAGTFRLLQPENYPNVPTDIDWDAAGCLRLPPFTVYPITFTLQRGESVNLHIEYVPLTLGVHSSEFVMLCDNCQVRVFTIKGHSKQIDMVISDLNDVPINASDTSLKRDVFFNPVYVGSEDSQSMSVCNSTGIPIEYEWVWVPSDTKDRDLSSLGRQGIVKRVHQEEVARNAAPATAPSSAQAISTPDPEADPAAAQQWALDNLTQDGMQSMNMSRSSSISSAVQGAFEIMPNRGVLAGDGEQTFTLNFSPTDIRTHSVKAVMMVVEVPLASFPTHSMSGLSHSHQQPALLRHLSDHGHGPHFRLKSWFRDIAVDAPLVTEDVVANKSGEPVKLVSMTMLVTLVVDHVLPRVKRNEFTDMDAEHPILEEAVCLFFDWVHRISNHAYKNRSPSTFQAEYDGLSSAEISTVGSEEGTDAVVSTKSKKWEFHFCEWVVKPFRFAAVTPISLSLAATEGLPPTMTKWNEMLQSKILSETWVDFGNALLVLATPICDFLNELVKHEVVSFLQDKCRTNVACLSTRVTGSGRWQHIAIEPPLLEIGGALSLDQVWSGNCFMQNPSISILQMQVQLESLVITDLSTGERLENTSEIATFKFEESEYTLMPHSRTTVSFELSFSVLGQYDIAIPLQTSSATDFSICDSIHIVVRVVEPRIRFLMPEIDIGLVGVGASERKQVTFTNESDCDCRYFFKVNQDEEAVAAAMAVIHKSKEKAEGTSKQKSHGPMASSRNLKSARSARSALSSSRSNMSERSSKGSVKGSKNDDGSMDSYAIENMLALLAVDPPAGNLSPGETKTVSLVCSAGRFPQRIRGTLEACIFNMTGSRTLGSQYLSTRGEVQSPMAIIYPTSIDLGKLYVGVPVKFTFTLENTSNLPSKYKLERPGGDAGGYKLNFDVGSGTLGSKSKVVINCEFIAQCSGTTDDVIACKVYGKATPLGFSVSAVAKGIALEFSRLAEGASVPRPLADPSFVQFPEGEVLPDIDYTRSLEFGDAVPLYERRRVQLLIRNFSAIPCTYSLAVEQFHVEQKLPVLSGPDSAQSPYNSGHGSGGGFGRPGSELSVHSSSGPELKGMNIIRAQAAAAAAGDKSAADMPDMMLEPHEEGENRFRSKNGRSYIGVRVMRDDDREYLTSRLGAAYDMTPDRGMLPAWGVQVITLKAFNDMPGCYNDNLTVAVRTASNPGTVYHTVPLQMTVFGCPLFIEKDIVGMSVIKNGAPNTIGKQMLQLGTACVNSEALVREFNVRNNGSTASLIRWQVRSLAAKVNGPVKFEIKLNATCRAKTNIVFWDDKAKDTPFTISPTVSRILPYERQKFIVTLFRTSAMGPEKALLTGMVKFESSGLQEDVSAVSFDMPASPSRLSARSSLSARGSLSARNGLASARGAANKNGFLQLSLYLQGDLVHPAVRIDKTVYVADSNPTIIPLDKGGIKLKTEASLLLPGLLNKHTPQDVIWDHCCKWLQINNPLSSLVDFTVSLEGPFVLRSSSMPTPRGKGALVPPAKADATVSHILLPHGSAKFGIAFSPPRSFREVFMNRPSAEKNEISKDTSGKIIIKFTTGQCLHIPLQVAIAVPFLSGSSPLLQFGTCLANKHCQGTMLLSNPTGTSARWSVVHVPGGGASRKISQIRVKGFHSQISLPEIDDPTAFVITPNTGSVEGPSVSVAAAIAAAPTDVNRLNDEVIVPQRHAHSNWATDTITLKDVWQQKHVVCDSETYGARFPMPVTVAFQPKANVKYSSRFRFECEYGNSFDVLLQGNGTFEEQEHSPLYPVPK